MNNFKFYNCNPHSTLTQDCVARALTAFTGKDYWDIVDELLKIYKNTGYHIIDPVCIMLYLDSLKIYKATVIKFPEVVSLKELCENLEKENNSKYDDILVLLQNSHLTYVHKYEIWDIWDCSKLNVSMYWIMGDAD